MAVQLQRRGAEVGLLALLDCYPKTADDGPAGITGAPGLAGALDLVGREINAPASLVESRVSALLRTAYHNRRLATGYVPGCFDGSLLFFQADADRAAGRTADPWTGSVSGDVTAHAVPATHMAMMDPAPLAQVGRALSVALARL
jgi:thioesterase domain-containing protein